MPALAQPELLGRRKDLLRRQLRPEPAVTKAVLVGDLERIAVADAAELLLEVVQLTDEILLRDLEIVQALAVRQLLVPFRRLRVDEIRRERTRIAAEERVREGAVAPEEAGQVQADEQLRVRIEQRAQRRG